jgi:hypothetical protein
MEKKNSSQDLNSSASCNDHSHSHDPPCTTCCTSTPNPSVCQNIDEMDFERGIWQAALDDNVQRIIHLITNQNVHVDAPDAYG